jgi:hypothetical protein
MNAIFGVAPPMAAADALAAFVLASVGSMFSAFTTHVRDVDRRRSVPRTRLRTRRSSIRRRNKQRNSRRIHRNTKTFLPLPISRFRLLPGGLSRGGGLLGGGELLRPSIECIAWFLAYSRGRRADIGYLCGLGGRRDDDRFRFRID